MFTAKSLDDLVKSGLELMTGLLDSWVAVSFLLDPEAEAKYSTNVQKG